jgi:hypothetical protein
MAGTAASAEHLKPHMFPKGTSGNPMGRPKFALSAIDIAKRHSPAAMTKLAEMAGLIPGVAPAAFESTRFAACREILDRALGRPAQTLLGDADKPVLVRFQWQSATDGTDNSAQPGQDQAQLVVSTTWAEVDPDTGEATPKEARSEAGTGDNSVSDD